MSALDQAFIRVYAKSTLLDANQMAARREPPVDGRSSDPARGPSAGTVPELDSLYADGTLYRDGRASTVEHRAVPSPHVEFDNTAIRPRMQPRPVMARNAAASSEIGLREIGPSTSNEVALPSEVAPTAEPVKKRGPSDVRHTPPANAENLHVAQPDQLQWVIATQSDGPMPPPSALDAPSTLEIGGESCHILLESSGIGNATVESGEACGEWIDVDWLDQILDSLQHQSIPPSPDASDAPGAPAETTETPTETPTEPTTEPTTDAPAQPVEEIQPESPPEVAWEVDRFRWPEICRQLYAAEQSYFEHAGEKLLEASRDGLRVLAVSSSQRGEGRTTLALMLARAAAAAGARVALLEADTHAPRIAASLGLDTPCDWPHAVGRQLSWTEAAIVSLADGITVLPLDDSGNSVSPRLAHPGVTRMLNELASVFDLVVIDGPPIGDSQSDFFKAGEDCPLNAVILVQDHRLAGPDRALDAVRRLRETGVEAIGIAHNFCRQPAE